MKTRDEFIRRWNRHLAGLALYGVVSETRDGPLVRAGKVLDIPAEVERLLGMMYEDLVPKEQPKQTPVNGNTPVPAKGRT